MTLDQHIAELRAELDHCLLTKSERAQIRAELEAALRDKAMRSLPRPPGSTRMSPTGPPLEAARDRRANSGAAPSAAPALSQGAPRLPMESEVMGGPPVQSGCSRTFRARPPEVDRPPAAQGRAPFYQDDLLVEPHGLHDLVRQDQRPALVAEGLRGAPGTLLPTPSERLRLRAKLDRDLAAQSRDLPRRRDVPHRRKRDQADPVEPGLLTLRPEVLPDLADGLVEKGQAHSVLAADIAGELEGAHVAQEVGLIEQEQYPLGMTPVGLHHGIDQRANDHPGDARIGLQHLRAQVQEDVELPARDVGAFERAAADEICVLGKREPLRVLGRRRVDAREGL